MVFFIELEQIILKCVWKPKRLNNQDNIEREKQSWMYHAPWFKTIPQSHSTETLWYWHKNRHISLEQNRESRNKPTLIQFINIWQGRQVSEETDLTMQKTKQTHHQQQKNPKPFHYYLKEVRQSKTNTVCFHLHVESKKQNKYKKTEIDSPIQRTN